LLSAENVPHDITDRLINVLLKSSVEEFNSTFKTMKDNVHIENLKYDPEYILHIAEMTYTEMVENGSWNSASLVQDSGSGVNSTCWKCGGKGHKADEFPSKKTSVSNPSGSNLNKERGK